jgi:hypothetical protein
MAGFQVSINGRFWVSTEDPTAVVAELLALFPELEQYWSTGHVGPHMRVWNPRNSRAVHNAV